MTRQSNLRSGTLQGRSVAAFVDWLTRAMRAHRGGGGLTVCDALCRNGITVWLQCTTEAHRLPLLCTTLRAQTHSPEPRRGSRSSNVRPTPTLSLHWQATRLILPESAPLTLRSVFVLGPLACLAHTHEQHNHASTHVQFCHAFAGGASVRRGQRSPVHGNVGQDSEECERNFLGYRLALPSASFAVFDAAI